jgi:triosephosphate isomerase
MTAAKQLAVSIGKAKTKHDVVICPPFPYIGLLKTKASLGAQTAFWEAKGAYTGQVSVEMLKQFGVKYVIVGHSEQRNLGQNDHEVGQTVAAVLKNKMIPILCVGHGLAGGELEEDMFFHVQSQLQNAFAVEGAIASKTVVAYEPVWAIGSGTAATPEHADRMAMFITIKTKPSKILYGGSVNAANAKSFLQQSRIDGLLIGGASRNQRDRVIIF